jgi:hypothetical protein
MMRGGVDWNCFVAPARFDKPVRAANGLAIRKFVQVVGCRERLQRGPTGQVVIRQQTHSGVFTGSVVVHAWLE